MTTAVEPHPSHDRTQATLGILVFALILFAVMAGLFAFKYSEQRNAVEQACAQTGPVAQLDLSSFVPLCRAVPQQ